MNFFFLFYSTIQLQLKIMFPTTYYNKFYALSSNIYFSLIKYFAPISFY